MHNLAFISLNVQHLKRDFWPKNHAVKLVNRVETRGKPAGSDGWPGLELASRAGLAENTARNSRGLGRSGAGITGLRSATQKSRGPEITRAGGRKSWPKSMSWLVLPTWEKTAAEEKEGKEKERKRRRRKGKENKIK
ncbi:hypothetical protein TIFTF001_054163 [Ficus carica]|uniref:Uncharacterized protein n=1 Tax=Ficus carica TaxID=3494 RepID=A0AA88EL34_FICCA|nr:hypothetical protein TIFTF001_054163 [Ficus carica]